jgi:hypothetical protein
VPSLRQIEKSTPSLPRKKTRPSRPWRKAASRGPPSAWWRTTEVPAAVPSLRHRVYELSPLPGSGAEKKSRPPAAVKKPLSTAPSWTVPAAVPSLVQTTRNCWVASKARKNRREPTAVSVSGANGSVVTRVVPAPVPSLFQSAVPTLKNKVPPTLTRPAGCPPMTSVTKAVPAVVPSVR